MINVYYTLQTFEKNKYFLKRRAKKDKHTKLQLGRVCSAKQNSESIVECDFKMCDTSLCCGTLV